jgi:hypothetical protein
MSDSDEITGADLPERLDPDVLADLYAKTISDRARGWLGKELDDVPSNEWDADMPVSFAAARRRRSATRSWALAGEAVQSVRWASLG